jgi:tetrahydromethanopterin S-methyltransferase subunit A
VKTEEAKSPLEQLIGEMEAASDAAKCHKCGCFHGALKQLTEALPNLSPETGSKLRPVLETGTLRTIAEEYDCLGCRVCWPANALNFAADAFPSIDFNGDSCPTESPTRELGWPPLPGDYKVLDSAGHVAVCALTSKPLLENIVAERPASVSIAGLLYTENLGIERIITNVLANPNITTLILCGADSEQRIGHLPGQTFLSLMANGTDEQGRIIGANGRRPLLKNISSDAVESFRQGIHVIDRIGTDNITAIEETLPSVPADNAPRRAVNHFSTAPTLIPAQPMERLVLDPKGYFVVFPDRGRHCIFVEHYTKDGTLTHVFTGERSDHLYATVIDCELISRLDHAAYLGKELARAEQALKTGEPYVQDAAPERATCESKQCGRTAC